MKRVFLILLTFCLPVFAQQVLPPSQTPYTNFTQGFQFNGSFGTLGMCAVSTGAGVAWGACPGGIAGMASDGANGIVVTGNVATKQIMVAPQFNGNGSLQFGANGETAFGDSITVGTGATDAAHRYITRILNAAGAPGINYAVSGDQAADQVYNQMYAHLAPAYYGNSAATIMVGTNDANFCASMVATAGCLANYFHTLLSGAAYATIPVQQQLQPQTAITGGACVTGGTWTNVTIGNVVAIQSIVPTSTITCTLYNSGAQGLYVNWLATSTGTSSAGLNIDSGTITDTLNGFGYNGQTILTHNGSTNAPFASRYGLSSTGSHTFTITVNTAGTGNPFTFLWAGSPTPSSPSAMANLTQNPPRIYIGGVIVTQSGGAGAPDAVTGAYDTQARLVVSTLAGDGALAYYAPTRAFVNSTTDFNGGTLPNGQVVAASLGLPVHPGNGGHQHIADAFLSVMYLAQPGVLSNALNDTAAGAGALTADISGGSNTAFGQAALAATTGFGNTGFGALALQLNTSGVDNTAVGVQAAGKNVSGTGITAVGYGAADNTTGNNNTAMGAQALFTNTSGANNVAIGQQALFLNIATNNTAVGTSALAANTSGTNNVALGTQALFTASTATSNTAVGTAALKLATASNNTAMGASSQTATGSGVNNTSSGYQSMLANTSGSNNSAFGLSALAANITHSNNISMGVNSLLVADADSNTALGTNALKSTTTGGSNVAVGYQAGVTATSANANVSGTNNTWVGTNAGPGSTTQFSNSTAIGNGAVNSASNQIQIGNAAIVSAAIGNTVIPVSASAQTVSVTVVNGTATMTTAAIAAGACGTTVQVTATNTLTTDAIEWSYNAAVAANPGVLIVNRWPTAGNVNFAYCNPTAGSITPSAATLNWRVVR